MLGFESLRYFDEVPFTVFRYQYFLRYSDERSVT